MIPNEKCLTFIKNVKINSNFSKNEMKNACSFIVPHCNTNPHIQLYTLFSNYACYNFCAPSGAKNSSKRPSEMNAAYVLIFCCKKQRLDLGRQCRDGIKKFASKTLKNENARLQLISF